MSPFAAGRPPPSMLEQVMAAGTRRRRIRQRRRQAAMGVAAVAFVAVSVSVLPRDPEVDVAAEGPPPTSPVPESTIGAPAPAPAPSPPPTPSPPSTPPPNPLTTLDEGGVQTFTCDGSPMAMPADDVVQLVQPICPGMEAMLSQLISAPITSITSQTLAPEGAEVSIVRRSCDGGPATGTNDCVYIDGPASVGVGPGVVAELQVTVDKALDPPVGTTTVVRQVVRVTVTFT